MKKQQPYIITERVVVDRHYNPEYGDDELCRCGHEYYRHFDTYEDMDPCGCKYCECYEFKEGGPLFTEEFVAPVIGGMSLVGVNGKPPHKHANYFWLGCGSRVLNFWAENLEAAATEFSLDDVKLRRYKGDGYDVCLIDDARIPKEWYLRKLCFTGCHGIPPLHVLEDIFNYAEHHYLLAVENELEQFTDPVSFYEKKGWKYHPETGVVSIPVNATPKKLQDSWTVEAETLNAEPRKLQTVWTLEVARDIQIVFDPDLLDKSMEELTKAICCESPPETDIVQAKQSPSKILLPPDKEAYFYAPHIPDLTLEQWDDITKQVEMYIKENDK